MSQYLYKKGSLKHLKKTIIELKEYETLLDVYEVTAICILNYNIDGIGSAIVEKCIIETIECQTNYGTGRRCCPRNSEYIIMSYSKLEEIMLSPDWIISDYSPSNSDHSIVETMKIGKHATKED